MQAKLEELAMLVIVKQTQDEIEVGTDSGEVRNVVTAEADTGQIGEVSDVGTGSSDTNGPHIGVEILGIDTSPPGPSDRSSS